MSGTMLTNPSRFASYAAQGVNGVNFDGTNDYLTRGADLTGADSSGRWSGSVWFKRAATGQMILYAGTTTRPLVLFGATDNLIIQGRNSGGTIVLSINTSPITDTASWHHVMWSVDLENAANRHLYVDGVSDLNVGTYEDEEIDFSRTDHAIGASTGGGLKYNGCFADLWLAFGQYIDLSLAANRLKFYNFGSAVDLGSDGSIPTGTAPIMYFTGDTATWHTNAGTGGGFTENGALDDCGTDP